MAFTLLGPIPSTPTTPNKYIAFERTLHLPTVKYLSGLLTVISLEGLYGTDMMMSKFFSSNLKVTHSTYILLVHDIYVALALFEQNLTGKY